MRDRLGRSAGRITGCGNHYHESNVCVAPLCVFLGIGWFEITPLELVRDEVIQAPKIEGIMMSYNSYRKKNHGCLNAVLEYTNIIPPLLVLIV